MKYCECFLQASRHETKNINLNLAQSELFVLHVVLTQFHKANFYKNLISPIKIFIFISRVEIASLGPIKFRMVVSTSALLLMGPSGANSTRDYNRNP